MHTITVSNVNEALAVGINMFRYGMEHQMILTAPRGQQTVEWHTPVTTVYKHPMERVLFSPLRDANPFFHLFESLWILAGRKDVKFLTHVLPRMADFSDDGDTFHAPYGHRLGWHFGIDQLVAVADMLKREPDTRRAVCSIWDPRADLDQTSKDIPCNDLLAFRVRRGALDLTVYNRSNDMIWGAYGANAVQFSFILEYVAWMAGLPVGRYYQVSNSFHVYLNEQWDKLKDMDLAGRDPYYDPLPGADAPIRPMPISTGATVEEFMTDLTAFFCAWDQGEPWLPDFTTPYFRETVQPMWRAFDTFKLAKANGNVFQLTHMPEWINVRVAAKDWALAAALWLGRRINK